MLHITKTKKRTLAGAIALLLVLASAIGIFTQDEALAINWTSCRASEINYTAIGSEVNGITGMFQLDSQDQNIGYFEREVIFGTYTHPSYCFEFAIHSGEQGNLLLVAAIAMRPYASYDLLEVATIPGTEVDDVFRWQVYAVEGDTDTLHYELINQTTEQGYFAASIDLPYAVLYPMERIISTEANMEYYIEGMYGGGNHTLTGLSYHHSNGQVDNFDPAQVLQDRDIHSFHPEWFDVSLAPTFTATLPAGWNTFSTPILLDADSDAMGQIFDAEAQANIEIVYRYNEVDKLWEQVTYSDEVLPLDGFVVKVKTGTSVTAKLTPDWLFVDCPIRYLPSGMNLVGIAPALEEGVFPATPIDEALASIEKTPEGWTGYTMVVSPSYNQPSWSYVKGMEMQDMLPCHSYWVVMENGDYLTGAYSPLPFVTEIHYKD